MGAGPDFSMQGTNAVDAKVSITDQEFEDFASEKRKWLGWSSTGRCS